MVMEKKSEGLNAQLMSKNLNQIIFEKEFNPKLSLSQNFENIADAARNKKEYKTKEFDPLGISSATRFKRYTIFDKDKPEGLKLKPIFGNTSLDDVASQYNAPLIKEYDAKKHLLNFLIEQENKYKSGGLFMNYGDYERKLI